MIDLRKSAELNNIGIIELYNWFEKYPQSNKRVICYCEECGRERNIKYYACSSICIKCANNDLIKKEKNSVDTHNYYSYQENRDNTGRLAREYWSRQENRDDQSIRLIEYWSHQKNRNSQSERLLNSDSRKSLAMRQSRDPKFGERVSAGKQHISYDEWEAFAAKKLYCPDFNEECKESNRNKYGRMCFLTSLPEEENIGKNGKQRNLSVHHVDMDKGQGCNGIKWKLVPLCMEWHSKVHNKLWEARIIWLLNNVWNNQKVYIG